MKTVKWLALLLIGLGLAGEMCPGCDVARSPTPESTASISVAAAALPPRGVAGDLWADVILGKPDFSEFTPHQVVPYKVFNPGGVIVDRSVSPGRMYVWDSGNSRVLGVDLAVCYGSSEACSAQVVIGQPSGHDHSACNGDSGFQRYPDRAPASAATLCGIPEDTLSILEHKSFVSMVVDPQGTLYVPDFFNHRVLKYISPFTTDAVADEVWGQTDFAGHACNDGSSEPTATTLCFSTNRAGCPYSWCYGGGVELDAEGNLWMADGGNNRVLRFPIDSQTGVVAKTADLVLGQPDFFSAAPGSALDQMTSPKALRFGPEGKLYVVDADNDRVLVFSPPFITGMSAEATFGSQLDWPTGLEMDPSGEGVWIYDFGNLMIELWDWDGATVKKVVGKDIYRLGQEGGGLLADGGGGFGFDTQGNLLPSGYVYIQDVLRFAAPIPTPQPGVVYQPDKRLFSPPFGYNSLGDRGLGWVHGVATCADQLVAADGIRLLFWNGLDTLSNGQPADGIIGSTEFSYFPSCCLRVKADASCRLWVQRVDGAIDTYPLPLTASSAPSRVIDSQATLPVLGGGSLTLGGRVDGLAPVGQGAFLWLSDTNNNRVVRIRDPLTAPVADVVLGQTEASGSQCNRGLVSPPGPGVTGDMICRPGGLAIDRLGNLYVSDHTLEVEGNQRLLVFDDDLFPATMTTAIFAPSATKEFPYSSAQRPATWEPAFDTTNRMVVGYNSYAGGRFVGVYDDPLGPGTEPDAYLEDFGSMPLCATFDERDNLYVGDLNRHRVLVYWTPFENSSPSQNNVFCP
jgi:DNA-binding beta-propeller fold protein YncE